MSSSVFAVKSFNFFRNKTIFKTIKHYKLANITVLVSKCLNLVFWANCVAPKPRTACLGPGLATFDVRDKGADKKKIK